MIIISSNPPTLHARHINQNFTTIIFDWEFFSQVSIWEKKYLWESSFFRYKFLCRDYSPLEGVWLRISFFLVIGNKYQSSYYHLISSFITEKTQNYVLIYSYRRIKLEAKYPHSKCKKVTASIIMNIMYVFSCISLDSYTLSRPCSKWEYWVHFFWFGLSKNVRSQLVILSRLVYLYTLHNLSTILVNS